ncbi:Zn-ribbon domain-containing OB-fold protein [Hydrocarboniphaga sp.]|uniref:Zn-ribbon domain-containing OB-fold protein n=1 Tax=Hydrocarboniphaga sp. TaxID=2033016 RepID=UPI003D108388
MTASRPIASEIFAQLDPPRLRGGRHRETGRIVFPIPLGAEAALYEPVTLADRGTLWSWTVQRFRPKSPPYAGPEQFVPYAVGYIELAGQLIVESRLEGVDFDRLQIGAPMELAVVAFSTAADGAPLLTYAFIPSKSGVAA